MIFIILQTSNLIIFHVNTSFDLEVFCLSVYRMHIKKTFLLKNKDTATYREIIDKYPDYFPLEDEKEKYILGEKG